jgi:hypothetical protein
MWTAPPPSAAPPAAHAISFANAIRTDMIAAFTLQLHATGLPPGSYVGDLPPLEQTQIPIGRAMALTGICPPGLAHNAIGSPNG